MSVERQTVLKAYGAEIVLTPVGEDMEETFATAKRMAEEFVSHSQCFSPGSLTMKPILCPLRDHCKEILEQTAASRCLVSGIGTGGTISTGRELKKAVPSVKW